MDPGKGIEEKENDNPLQFSGEAKDWPSFKEATRARADSHHVALCRRTITS